MDVRRLTFPTLFRRAPRPATPSRGRARRAAAVALGCGLAAFVAVQVALVAASAATRWVADPLYTDKRDAMARVERAAPHGAAKVLLLGTSRASNGFDAGRVQSESGRAGVPAVAFNFGVAGAGPVTHLVYLRRLLADGHRPDLLVVEVLPALLSDAPDGPIEGRALAGDRLTRAEVELAVQYGLPAERTRRQWRGAVLLPVSAHRFKLVSRVAPDALPWQFRSHAGRISDAHGWCPALADQVSDAERERLTAAVALEYRGAFAHELPAGPAAEALRDLLELCRAEGVPVALVLFPEATTFRALYARTEPRLQRFLAELRAEFGRPVTDAREWLADDAFADGHHLLRPGAEAFTDRFIRDALVPLLRARRHGGRE